jgi:hypothetical protein
MNLFINDKPVKILKMDENTVLQTQYHLVLDGQVTEVKASQLVGDVLVFNPSVVLLYKLFDIMRTKKLKKLRTLTLASPSKKILVDAIKAQFKIVEAAGGVVRKDNKILLIYRLKKWDLPKGKLEKNEKFKAAAVREVEEECCVQVKLDEKICSTWHTYMQNGNRILKKTKWYAMTCTDDSDMKPQAEEGIEKIIWAEQEQVESLLADSYSSIEFVCHRYFNKKKTLEGQFS